MSQKSGVSPGALSLPSGGGAVSGAGGQFMAERQTGAAQFDLPIDLPDGRNGHQPGLALQYSSGNGNGVAGLGWSLSVGRIARKTKTGVPVYDPDEDTFVLSGAEDLVAVDSRTEGSVTVTRYRPRTEGSFGRIERHRGPSTDHWTVESPDGTVEYYGTPGERGDDPAVVADPDDRTRVFEWRRSASVDPFGNRIEFEYDRDGDGSFDQLYLDEVRYVDYEDGDTTEYLVTVDVEYGDRPDVHRRYEAGFQIRTRRRCERIVVRTHADRDRTVRSYELTYADEPDRSGETAGTGGPGSPGRSGMTGDGDVDGSGDAGDADDAGGAGRSGRSGGSDGEGGEGSLGPANGASLLTAVQVVGHDDGDTQRLPPTSFEYSSFDPADRTFETLEGSLPEASLSAPELELADVFGDGLPDLVEIDDGVRYWRNEGDLTFSGPHRMETAPSGLSLSDPTVQLLDADGDGRVDLVSTGRPAGYVPLSHDGGWDERGFRAYETLPTVDLGAPDVARIDLDGDGATDALRSSEALECFFQDPDTGWTRTERTDAEFEAFGIVDFTDPRVRVADMSGDGLDDLVYVDDGRVVYVPNRGHGDWGDPVVMRAPPDLPRDYDPGRLLVGDVDGDGASDVVYVEDDRVRLWVNVSGGSFADPVAVEGTPQVADTDALRLVDLAGTGIGGVLWNGSGEDSYYLDFVGGRKPYLLEGTSNNLGASTTVEYDSSTVQYLAAERDGEDWQCTLPQSTWVVSAVENVDEVGDRRVRTEYSYRHGYWDGAEREFRGFGMVETRDSETFEEYRRSDPAVGPTGLDADRFQPPTVERTWYHLGPVGPEHGDWRELDYAGEYWTPAEAGVTDWRAPDDPFWDRGPPRIARPAATRRLFETLDRRDRRDAVRSLRGTELRTEVYARDGSDRQHRPYRVTQHTYGVREEDAPAGADRRRVFFPHRVAEATTEWERGDDPRTHLSFVGDYDPYGQPRRSLAVDLPRGWRPGEQTGDYLASVEVTRFARSTDPYIVDREAEQVEFEVVDDAPRTVAQLRRTVAGADLLTGDPDLDLRLTGLARTYFDGDAFEGRSLGEVGAYGAAVRTAELVLTDETVRRAYRESPVSDAVPPSLDGPAPDEADYPARYRSGVPSRLGRSVSRDRPGPATAGVGYCATTTSVRDDGQTPSVDGDRGLLVARRDRLGAEREVLEYEYGLNPVRVQGPMGTVTEADYDYSAMNRRQVTDPNGNRTRTGYTPLGLPAWRAELGAPGEDEGDTPDRPGVRYEYGLRAYERGSPDREPRQPAWIHTSVRKRFPSAVVAEAEAERGRELTDGEVADLFEDERQRHPERFVEQRQYSDGFGRVVQTRAEAESLVFDRRGPGADGEVQDGADGVLPAEAGPDAGTVGVAVEDRAGDGPRVTVSGFERFNNKGEVVTSYEQFFDTGWAYLSREAAATRPDVFENRTDTYYDAVGRERRVVHPDGSERRVVRGRLDDVRRPDEVDPSPWVVHEYSRTDNAGRTHDGEGARRYRHRWNVPTTTRQDARGREVATVVRNRDRGDHGPGDVETHHTRHEYDGQGNLIRDVDALGRVVYEGVYDLRGQELAAESADAGSEVVVVDAAGRVRERRDANGALQLLAYDDAGRETHVWARDPDDDAVTLREHTVYGESLDRSSARERNLLGEPHRTYDEAGLVVVPAYDFRGQETSRVRRPVTDEVVVGGPVDWSPDAGTTPADRESTLLSGRSFELETERDALGRPTVRRFPRDVDGDRKELQFEYTPSGSLRGATLVTAPGTPERTERTIVEAIGYDPKGRRSVVALGNGVMTRYQYDDTTHRLSRIRSEQYERRSGDADGIAGDTFAPDGSVFQDVQYEYDVGGAKLLARHQAPHSGVTGAPQSAPDGLEHGRDVLIRRFGYDALGRVTEATGRECTSVPTPREWGPGYGGNADACGYGTADVNRTNAPDQTALYTETYSYDPAGNLTELSHTQHDSGGSRWTRQFGYDGVAPGDWAPSPWDGEGDPAGSGRRRSDGPTGGNRLTHVGDDPAVGSATHGYDAAGNLRSERNSRYDWDHDGRLRAYAERSGGTASVEAGYAYDGGGQRVKKVVDKGPGHREVTVSVGGLFEYRRQAVGGAGGAPTTVREHNAVHVEDDTGRVAIERFGRPFGEDRRFADADRPRTEFHLRDAGQNSSVVLDGSGRFVNREEYTPFGETVFGGYRRKRFRFAGGERDEESGLSYHDQRYYAPWLCRWTATDPAGAVDAQNLYLYATNDPVNGVDPTGTQQEDDQSKAGGVCRAKPADAESRSSSGAGGNGSLSSYAGGLEQDAEQFNERYENDKAFRKRVQAALLGRAITMEDREKRQEFLRSTGLKGKYFNLMKGILKGDIEIPKNLADKQQRMLLHRAMRSEAGSIRTYVNTPQGGKSIPLRKLPKHEFRSHLGGLRSVTSNVGGAVGVMIAEMFGADGTDRMETLARAAKTGAAGFNLVAMPVGMPNSMKIVTGSKTTTARPKVGAQGKGPAGPNKGMPKSGKLDPGIPSQYMSYRRKRMSRYSKRTAKTKKKSGRESNSSNKSLRDLTGPSEAQKNLQQSNPRPYTWDKMERIHMKQYRRPYY